MVNKESLVGKIKNIILRKEKRQYKIGDKYFRISRAEDMPYVNNGLLYLTASKCSYCAGSINKRDHIIVRHRPKPKEAEELRIIDHHKYDRDYQCSGCKRSSKDIYTLLAGYDGNKPIKIKHKPIPQDVGWETH